ncbi:hypothetical protein [Vibrio agarivorans]|uniref:hypothetical protein n=1 Tax=Vibrio agarivorans TaxID=153622 RepID=UPI0025B33F88|nr:hypothetical protein [Vibrio agarivorans]MDN3661067.1 hypothetical protein [Vibrio agarivorans]
MSKALDRTSKKTQNRRAIIIGVVICLLVLAFIAYKYASMISHQPETIDQANTKRSRYSQQPASLSTPKADEKTLIQEDSPAARVADAQEQRAKEEAQELGKSHMDSTNAIQEKTERIEAEFQYPPLPDKPTKVAVQVAQGNSKGQATTRDQLLINNISKLLMPNPALPKQPDFTALIQASNQEIDSLPRVRSAYGSAASQVTYYGYVEDQAVNDEGASDYQTNNRARLGIANDTNPSPAHASRNPTAETEDEEPMVRVLNLGDMLMTELRWQIVSDYRLPVFFDVVEPPLKAMVLQGNFEITPRQDGVLLRVTQFQMGDLIQPINGYGVNITTDLTPLFDHDVDTHFAERFLSRASAAFMTPFLGFVKATTTTIENGNVIISDDPVTGTKDRIIGGLASVAEEFLPDLRKNANIQPTITIPNGYPVGIVFTQTLSLPESLLSNYSKATTYTYTNGVNY